MDSICTKVANVTPVNVTPSLTPVKGLLFTLRVSGGCNSFGIVCLSLCVSVRPSAHPSVSLSWLKMKAVGQTVQAWERKQRDGQTDGHYQVHYLPRFAVDKNMDCPLLCALRKGLLLHDKTQVIISVKILIFVITLWCLTHVIFHKWATNLDLGFFLSALEWLWPPLITHLSAKKNVMMHLKGLYKV